MQTLCYHLWGQKWVVSQSFFIISTKHNFSVHWWHSWFEGLLWLRCLMWIWNTVAVFLRRCHLCSFWVCIFKDEPLLYVHLSMRLCLFSSLNHCRIKSEILGYRYEALLLMEVHHCWHTQEYTFPHTSHHCQPPAVPVSVVIVCAERERCPRKWKGRSSLLCVHVFLWGWTVLMWVFD